MTELSLTKNDCSNNILHMGKKPILIRVDENLYEKMEKLREKMKREGYPVPNNPQIVIRALEKYLEEVLEEDD
jgi:hypothetical protein